MTGVVVILIGMAFLSSKIGVVAWVLGGIGAILYYRFDVRRRPRVPCRVCSGSGADSSHIGGGWLFRKPFGLCWCCGGRKAHARLALRLFDSSEYQRVKGEIAKGRGQITR